jgi:4-hydroxyphenylpyruvate dioxygenase-like putative hemolysin
MAYILIDRRGSRRFFSDHSERSPVNARHLDHLTLRIPDDGEDAARAFYGETLGFPIS